MPLRVEGGFRDLAWHVIDGRNLPPGASHEVHATTGPHGVEADARGTLVGFYSRRHAGVFTHMGEASHFHFVGNEISGHVDGAGLRAGSTLFIGR